MPTQSSQEACKIPHWAIKERKRLPAAIVLKWNDSDVYVICPFTTCARVHKHGFSRVPKGYPNRRLSHCAKLKQTYQLVWPFEADSIAEDLELGFQLDRDAGIWRTIGGEIEDPDTHNELDAMVDEHVDDQPGEQDLLRSLEGLSLDGQDYMYFISHCVANDIKEALAYLKDETLSATFLHKRNEEGNTVLALVCMEGHHDMAKVLVKHGSPLDIKNGQGETPLIIALQYGRIEIATYLVSCGASIRSRDAQGSGVLSHSKELRDRLEQKRLSICMPSSVESNTPPTKHVLKNTNGAIVMEYFEDPNPSVSMRYLEHQERMDLLQCLINACDADEASQKRIQKHKQSLTRHARERRVSVARSTVNAMVTVFRDAYEVPMANGRKTFAYLDRGQAHGLVFAVSGWSGGHFADIDGCVDRTLWTERVFQFSRMVGHTLKRHTYDGKGPKGIFHACHAEKQLMAFVLWHYTPLQEVPKPEASESDWNRFNAMGELHRCTKHCLPLVTGTKQCEKYRGPPVNTIKPVIYVTHTVCTDCQGFRQRILNYTGIDISVKKIT